MMNTCSRSNKGPFNAAISGNRQIGRRFYRLGLEFEGPAAAAFAALRPGQFAELDLAGTALPAAEAIPEELADSAQRRILLRRPFSFSNIIRKGPATIAEILYCVVGPASLRMTTLSKDDSISVIGPLGSGFSMPNGKKTALLVAGGMGAGPLEHLAKVIRADLPAIDVIAFAGARTKTELPFENIPAELSQQPDFGLAEFAEYGVKSAVATDDGSAGFAGLVTDCLSEWLGNCGLSEKDMIIYGCGPEPMLAKIAQIAAERNIDCQLSMERRMACGIGICQSCAVECKQSDSNETIYKLCCEDGPVFDSQEIVFKL